MKRLAMIGGGNMGEALLSGLLKSGAWKPAQIRVSDVRAARRARLQRLYRVRVSADNLACVREAQIVLLAVKPQQMSQVLSEIGSIVRSNQLVLSIAAGITTRFIEKRFDQRVPVVRMMPNTPALIGLGASAIAKGRYAGRKHERTAMRILQTVGTARVVRESQMDAVTALSGSGPAYVFYLAEVLKDAGRRLGLPVPLADGLVRQTIQGAGALLARSVEEASALRRRVTSPGGTTEAALEVLEKAGLRSIFSRALYRAAGRSRELSRDR